jgi:ATP-dependent RNA helicase DDX55/SPB4
VKRLCSRTTNSRIEKGGSDATKMKKHSLPWSQHREKRVERGKRKQKKIKKSVWLKTQQTMEPGPATHSLKRDQDEWANEWDELAKEERMAKKLRKGDVSLESFDKEFMSL